jgi:hypothetical protein
MRVTPHSIQLDSERRAAAGRPERPDTKSSLLIIRNLAVRKSEIVRRTADTLSLRGLTWSAARKWFQGRLVFAAGDASDHVDSVFSIRCIGDQVLVDGGLVGNAGRRGAGDGRG